MSDDQTDPHAGHGGSYTLDPATGARALRERTQEAATAAAEQPSAPAAGAED